jgi:cullin-4
MKNAKLPASSSSSSSSGPTEKYELHLDPTTAAARGAGSANGEEDAEMLLADQDELRAPGASAPRGSTANLYRKKARLSQPSAPTAAR